jgi:hypothetical protein
MKIRKYYNKIFFQQFINIKITMLDLLDIQKLNNMY